MAEQDAVQVKSLAEISQTDRQRIVRVLGEAFSTHPMVPPDPPGKPTHWGATLMMGTMLKAFSGAPDANILHIDRDGEPACVAFVHACGYEPPKTALPGMMFQMMRVMGLRRLGQCMAVLSEKHPGNDRRLELLILGTQTRYHQQGLGRRIMHAIFDDARRRDYVAVTLEAARNSPAFGFYQREGFVVEKQVELLGQPLCWMRRDLDQPI
jgi:ribosomal protein S18 acetylase RimI-like enzyme